MSKLRLAFWFACHDLWAPVARWTTLNCWFTLFVVVLMGLVSLGVLAGYRSIHEHRLHRDPLARCLWIGKPTTEEKRLSDAQLARLSGELPGGPSKSQAWGGPFPFSAVEFDWYAHPKLGARGRPRDDRVPRLGGRTLAPGDPLLVSLRIDAGRRFLSDEEPGVVVTKALLEDLDQPAGPPPATLAVRAADGLTVELPVVGVIADDLPFGDRFVMNQAAYDQFDAEHRDVPVPSVETGAIPDDWLSEDALRKAEAALQRYDILEPQLCERGRVKTWKLEAREVPQLVSSWRIYVNQIRKIMEESGFSPAPKFAQLRPDRPNMPAAAPTAEQPRHDRAAVYVQDLGDLQAVAAACRRLEIFYDHTIVDQMERLSRDTLNAWWVLVGSLFLLALMAFWSLLVIQSLVTRQKIAEIGMLKAIGMQPGLLATIYLCETLLILIAAVLLALVVAWPAGYWLAPLLFEVQADASERSLAFQLDWLTVSMLLVVFTALNCLTTWWATRGARTLPPLQTLGGGGG